MPNSTLSAMTGVSSMDGTELLYAVKSGLDRKVTANQLMAVNRIILRGSTTYYVSVGGNDSTGDGSIGNPWATLQHAVDYVANFIDINQNRVSITLVAGTVGTPNVYGSGTVTQIKSFVGGGTVVIETSDGNPLTTTLWCMGLIEDNDTAVGFGGMTITSGTTAFLNFPIFAVGNLTFFIGTNTCPDITFAAASGNAYNISLSDHATFSDDIETPGTITIAPTVSTIAGHILAQNNAHVILFCTSYVITGNPNWGGAFLVASQHCVIESNMSATGSATGYRYSVDSLSFLIHTPSAITTIPGSSDYNTASVPTNAVAATKFGTTLVSRFNSAAFFDLTMGYQSVFTGQLQFASSASANFTTIQSGNATNARTYTLPIDFGPAGGVLTDAAGNGTLGWITPISSVGGLPSASSGNIGVRMMVNDASSSPTFWGVATGSSNIIASVVSDGTNWRYG